MTAEKDGIRTNGEVWAEHGHHGEPCSPPEAVHGLTPCRLATGGSEWTREDRDGRTDRLKPLAEHLRVGHDVDPDQRRYRDTWLHIALLADEWFIEPEGVSEGDRRDVAAWLRREADQRVKFFSQRRDGVDALMRRLADHVYSPGPATPKEDA